MGHLQHKYTQHYFLQFDKSGKKTDYGVIGLEDFLLGKPRPEDLSILKRIDFKDKNVLDIGFGRGEIIKYTSEQGANKVVGVDFSEAAFAIASNFLDVYKVKAKLYCQDALEFIKNFKQQFDIVILFDVVEHIPRSELDILLEQLKTIMIKRSVILINTPVFACDNDVIKEGLKPENMEDTDTLTETKGMHINRYTKKSLANYMLQHNYFPVSGHIFAYTYRGKTIANRIGHNWRKASSLGYPLKSSSWFLRESFDYAYSRKRKRLENQALSRKILVFPIWFVKALLYRLGYRTFEEKRRSEMKILPILYGKKRGQLISGNVFTSIDFQKRLLGLK